MTSSSPDEASAQPKRVLSETNVEYTYDVELTELKGDDSVVALMLMIFETRTETNVYVYPGWGRSNGSERTTEEEDVQRRVIDSHSVKVPKEQRLSWANEPSVPSVTHPPGQVRTRAYEEGL